jgi:hypothetical protein
MQSDSATARNAPNDLTDGWVGAAAAVSSSRAHYPAHETGHMVASCVADVFTHSGAREDPETASREGDYDVRQAA